MDDFRECETCGHSIWDSQELCTFCEANWGTEYFDDYITRYQQNKKREKGLKNEE